MQRTHHAAIILLGTSVFAPACLLNAGPYESGGAAGTTGTTTSTNTTSSMGGSTGGTTSMGGSTGGTTSSGGAVDLCGNGAVDPPDETCDLGPNNSEHGACTTECKDAECGDGFVYNTGSGMEQCDDGAKNADTAACTSMCKTAFCGDGLVWAGHEDCDDGNTTNGDGCSSTCTTTCGDNKVVGNEQCEDGNTNAGDGCSAKCQIEAACGNGRVDPGEVCDGGGACMNSCQEIDPNTACGKAVSIVPAPPNDVGVRSTHVEGDTNDMQTPNGELLNPSCCDPHKARLFTYTTGDRGAIVFASTSMGMVQGTATYDDTTLWVYRDCVNKAAEEACSDDISGGNHYSQIQTGYLPARTTLFIGLGGHGDGDLGKFVLDIVERPVTLLWGSTFDTDLGSLSVDDAGQDGAKWQWCDGAGACGPNSTASWSGRGFAGVYDGAGRDLGGETLTTVEVDPSQLNTIYVQYAFNFQQNNGSPTEYFNLNHATDGSTYTLVSTQTTSTPMGARQRFDVSGAAKSTMNYSVQMYYDDAGGDGTSCKIDDLYIYGY